MSAVGLPFKIIIYRCVSSISSSSNVKASIERSLVDNVVSF